MKSDTPDELFVFPDRNFSDRSNITQEDIDDMFVDFSFPLRNSRYGPVIDVPTILEDDLPF